MEDKDLKKIELNFYNDDPNDLALLKLINKYNFKRGREFVIKNILKEYFLENYKEEYIQKRDSYKKIISNRKRLKKHLFRAFEL